MNFLKLNYWLNTNPGSLEAGIEQKLLYFIGFLLICLVVSSVFNFRIKKGLYKKVIASINTFFIVNFLISLYLWFVTYEGAYILAMRLWFLVWIALMAVWIYCIVKIYKKIPEIKQQKKEKEAYQKYIP